ncbi:sulfatase-like hydrolase/transferase [bacterium]|nr:sulfatase-like hydrolase/transferase [bacterium]
MGLASTAIPTATAKKKPNFIVLFADDMGYGDVECFGHPTINTPHLNRMAREGIRLTSFYAGAPVCTPSRAALMTGRYPKRAGQPQNLGPGSKKGLPLSEITLAEQLKKGGYKTMCIGKWHLGHNPDEYMPTSRGFDHYYGLLYSNDMIPPWVNTDKPLKLYRDLKPVEHPVDQSTLTERYTREAVKFIRDAKDDPFFLYLPYAMPHLPISASSRKGTSRAGLYGDVIETIDWSVGTILNTLMVEGLDEDTMVVFTSDNGPWLNLPSRMLQDGVKPWHCGFKNLLRGHKGNTYEGGLREPCIFRWPGTIPAGQTSADMACTMDIFATILETSGVGIPQDRVIDGMNILPFLKGQSPSPRKEFYYSRGDRLEAVREGPWKLRMSRTLRNDLKKGDPLPPELFQLDWDPAEQYNMAGQHPDLVDKLLKKLHAKAKEIGAKVPK